MKVKDLIQELQGYNEDLTVMIDKIGPDGNYHHILHTDVIAINEENNINIFISIVPIYGKPQS